MSDKLVLSITERDRDLMLRTGVEECRYFGHLENEKDACLVMTGCPGIEDVEFTILSKNVQESPAFLWTVDGSVEAVDLKVQLCQMNISSLPLYDVKLGCFEMIQCALKVLLDSRAESMVMEGYRSFQRGTFGLCRLKCCRATSCQIWRLEKSQPSTQWALLARV